MIQYIGDISKNDSIVLREYAEKYNRILEFGCGASTQILTNYTNGYLKSIDTSKDWIEKTKFNISFLKIKNIPTFYDYNLFMQSNIDVYDFIFDDGVDSLRLEFALNIWKFLEIDGCLAFHDTRRWHDQKNVIDVVHKYYNEIESIKLNYRSSNITILKKKASENYVEWNIAENREQWEIGHGNPPENFNLTIECINK